MQGVRRVLSDPRVAAGGIEAAVGKRRKVVAVDDVVRDARVLRHLSEDRLENFCSFLLPRVRLVRRHRERDTVQRECVEDRRLAVFRILRRQRGHRLLEGKKTRDVVDRVRLVVIDAERLDVVPLSARRSFGGTSRGRWRELLERAACGRQILLRPERMVEAHRLAPVRERE